MSTITVRTPAVIRVGLEGLSVGLQDHTASQGPTIAPRDLAINVGNSEVNSDTQETSTKRKETTPSLRQTVANPPVRHFSY